MAGPAGFGKTTLVAEWRSSAIENRPFAWVSLDRGDDDPVKFWWHIICALQRVPSLTRRSCCGGFGSRYPDVSAELLPALVNELAALSAPVVLVLDDYHAIRERNCHEQMKFLLHHLPSSVQIVLVTRADPPLPLGRLRATREMVELRMRQLRFDLGEATTLVRAVCDGISLDDRDLADLVERTEGWPAAVYLAALSLRGHPAPGAFVREFTGDNRAVCAHRGRLYGRVMLGVRWLRGDLPQRLGADIE